jgi:hypothetical protein
MKHHLTLLDLGEELLGHVVACLDVCSVAKFGCACKATSKVALADSVFQLRLMDELGIALQVCLPARHHMRDPVQLMGHIVVCCCALPKRRKRHGAGAKGTCCSEPWHVAGSPPLTSPTPLCCSATCKCVC